MYKAYCDASFDADTNTSGVGIVVTDDLSNSVVRIDTAKVNAKSSNEAELKALLRAAFSLKEYNDVIYCTDDLKVVRMVQGKEPVPRKYKGLLENILSLINYEIERVVWIARELNKQADALAVYAARRND